MDRKPKDFCNLKKDSFQEWQRQRPLSVAVRNKRRPPSTVLSGIPLKVC